MLMTNVRLHKLILVVLVSLFLALTAWWLYLYMTVPNDTNDVTHMFGGTYGLLALVAGLYGLAAAKGWGFLKSYFGKAIIFLSIGLLLSEFGQLTFLYYNVVEHIDVPYPSIADIGFFGAVPAYILGAWFLSKGLGVWTLVKRSPLKLVIGIAVPLVVLSVSFMLFLNGYDASEKDPLTIFLDFGYPLGQATYVSLALVTFLSLGRMLGGVMKMPVLLLLAAFGFQYAADFNFLYQVVQETWNASGSSYGDYIYLFAYFLMGLSLVSLSTGLSKVYSSNKVTKEAT